MYEGGHYTHFNPWSVTRAHAHTGFSRRGSLQHHFFTFFPFLLHLNWIDFLSSFLAAMIVSISFNLLGSTLLTGRRRPRRSVDFYLFVFADLVFRSPQIVLIHSSAQETQRCWSCFSSRSIFPHSHRLSKLFHRARRSSLFLWLSFSHSNSHDKNTSLSSALFLSLRKSFGWF